jgi:hypothetical protein
MDGVIEAGDEVARAKPAEPPRGSVSFVITSYRCFEDAQVNLDVLRPTLREGDEVIVLAGADPVRPMSAEPWYRIVKIPDASEFTLRAQIPALCRKDWVVLLEEHSRLDGAAIAAIRRTIDQKPDTEMIVFLAKNLTSVSRSSWAVFLHTFALIWAPLRAPPPFSPVTSGIVKRAALGSEALAEGVWELRLIPQIFGRGKVEYSNDIFIDHYKPMSFAGTLLIAFDNARAGAALQRALGIPMRNILYEGWYCLGPRPRELAAKLADRRHELPAGIFALMRLIGLAHLMGNFVGGFLGAGRSAYRL